MTQSIAAPPSATAEITIQNITFNAPLRYAEGHTCTQVEAEQLNSVLHDNLRNNFARRIKEYIEARPNRPLTAEEIDALRVEFDAYAANYALTTSPRRFSNDPVERTARAIARDLLAEQLRKSGRRIADCSDAELDNGIASLARNPRVREEAQRRVDTTRAIATSALDIF